VNGEHRRAGSGLCSADVANWPTCSDLLLLRLLATPGAGGSVIDLSAENAAAFGRLFAPYIGHARKAGRAPGRRAGRTASTRQRSGDIRAWAKEHGLAVSERGRIPASVVEQYHAAGGER
jgi:hypothetical protein